MIIVAVIVAILSGAASALVVLWLVERRRTRLFKKAFAHSLKGFQKELVILIVELTTKRHPLALELLRLMLTAVMSDQPNAVESHARKSLADQRFEDLSLKGKSVIPPMPASALRVSLQEANLSGGEAEELKLAAAAQAEERHLLQVKEMQEFKKSPKYQQMQANSAELLERMKDEMEQQREPVDD